MLDFLTRANFIIGYVISSVAYVILGKLVTYVPSEMIVLSSAVIMITYAVSVRLPLQFEDKRMLWVCFVDVGDVVARTICVYFINVDFATVLLIAEAPWGLVWKRKERSWKVLLLIATISAGAFLTSYGSIEDVTNFKRTALGVTLALVSTNCRVAVNVMSEDIMKNATIEFHQFCLGVGVPSLALGLSMAGPSFESIQIQFLPMSIIMGIILVFGIEYCYFNSCQPEKLPVSMNLAMRTLQLPLIYCLSFLILGEIPNVEQVIGASIVFVFCIALVIQEEMERPVTKTLEHKQLLSSQNPSSSTLATVASDYMDYDSIDELDESESDHILITV